MENLIGISIIAIALAFIVLLISNRNLIATISIIIIVFVSYTTTVRIENVIDEGFVNVVTSPIIMETDENRPQFGRLQESGMILGNDSQESGSDFVTADMFGQTTAPELDVQSVQITTPR